MPTIGCGHWNGRRNRLPHLVDQSFGEVGGAGGFACRWKLISIAHPNPENGYAPHTLFPIANRASCYYLRPANPSRPGRFQPWKEGLDLAVLLPFEPSEDVRSLLRSLNKR